MEYKSLPDLVELATLKAVVELGGVAPAARALHVGQPAVTKRLRTLDARYGVMLMNRQGRRLELTLAGERVYAFARLVLDHQALLLRDLEYLSEGRNSLRLAASQTIGEHLLPKLLLRFADAHPEYRLDSSVGYSRNIQTELATGLVGLGLLEHEPDHPDILAQKWLEDELLLVCGREHPLARVEGPITIPAMAELNHVLREPMASVRVTLDKALADINAPRLKVAMEVGATQTIVEMLEHGKHVSFMPRFVVAEGLASGHLVHLRVVGLRILRTLWIGRTRSNLQNPVAEAFVKLVRDML
ncbi:MAG: LysR family transcriptional regulator [Gammaproteobacteria bacterium]|nr:LysR family transcriptional regulator [Gammaproteobacteria bacterium]MCP5137892.1 LysR family transcriptional regulator [Gammaproteobacteria bacterium]